MPNRILRVTVTKPQLELLVKSAMQCSVWFDVTPLSDGYYEMAVKDEPTPIAKFMRLYL